MRRALALVGTGLLLTSCQRPAAEPPPSAVQRLPSPPESTLKDDALSRAVRRGRALLADTRDSLPAHVGNALRCNSCHLDEGTRAFSMPYVGVYARYPQYRSRRAAVELIEDRINDCFVRSMNGKPLDPAGPDMRDIAAYLAWLSRGITVGQRIPGQGIDSIVPPLAGDSARGALVFLTHCVRCHGAGGEGAQVPTSPGLYAPPLWGARSFNIGAGMARLRVTAAFVRTNMPFDAPGTLSPQQAFDVAAYVNAHARPDFEGKEGDWPRGDPPPDVAYRTRAARASPPR